MFRSFSIWWNKNAVAFILPKAFSSTRSTVSSSCLYTLQVVWWGNNWSDSHMLVVHSRSLVVSFGYTSNCVVSTQAWKSSSHRLMVSCPPTFVSGQWSTKWFMCWAKMWHLGHVGESWSPQLCILAAVMACLDRKLFATAQYFCFRSWRPKRLSQGSLMSFPPVGMLLFHFSLHVCP